MRTPPVDAASVRFVVELCQSQDGVDGWVRRGDAAAVPFSGWLELLALLEPTAP